MTNRRHPDSATAPPRPSTPPAAPPAAPPGRADPLTGIERLVVDGTNVIHALGAGRGPAPPASLIGRLRAVVPTSVAIDLVFDEPPAPGLGRRIGPGLRVHHAADRSADDLIVGLVVEAAARSRPGYRGRPIRLGKEATSSQLGQGPVRVLVVTDDAELRRRVRHHGATTAPVRWLVARLSRPRLVAPAAGRRRPPAPAASSTPPAAPDVAESDDREPWRPGRGATRKRGNPRRPPRTGRGRASNP